MPQWIVKMSFCSSNADMETSVSLVNAVNDNTLFHSSSHINQMLPQIVHILRFRLVEMFKVSPLTQNITALIDHCFKISSVSCSREWLTRRQSLCSWQTWCTTRLYDDLGRHGVVPWSVAGHSSGYSDLSTTISVQWYQLITVSAYSDISW